MALEGTHIRFAAALKDELKVVDIDKFIAGTIYPDSRYLTGINRDLTHNDDFLDKDFLVDDFNKGWFVHCLCDKVQLKALIEYFPQMMNSKDKDEWFVNFSALKNVQDLYEMKNFDIQPYLKCLDYVDNPNQEEIKKIAGFNKMVQKMYSVRDITMESLSSMWLTLGLKPEIVGRVIAVTAEFSKDKKIMIQIEKVFDKMLINTKNYKF